MISAKFLWGNVLLGGKQQIDAKNSNFQIFESALYMKSVSMPLNNHLEANFRDFKEWHKNFSMPSNSRAHHRNSILHLLINVSRTDWPTEISKHFFFLRFSDKLLKDDENYSFKTRC